MYTDCVDRPFTVSRASLLINDCKEVFSEFNMVRVILFHLYQEFII